MLWYPVYLICIQGTCTQEVPKLPEYYFDTVEECYLSIEEQMKFLKEYIGDYEIEEFLVLADCIPKKDAAKL